MLFKRYGNMNINNYKYKKNPDYEESYMEDNLYLFTGSVEHIFTLGKKETLIFDLFDKTRSIDDAVNILIKIYAGNDIEKINVQNECECFITQLIKNKLLLEEAS